VAITCGANMNFDRLRFVAERAEFGEQREALFAVTIPEERGSFRRFCELIGPAQRDRVQLPHLRRSGWRMSSSAWPSSAATRPSASRALRAARLCHRGPDRRRAGQGACAPHGGRALALAHDERLFRFEFPERPGALMRFLAAMHPGWNISLFHYRNQGADYGRILVGMQVPRGDEGGFDEFLRIRWPTPASKRRPTRLPPVPALAHAADQSTAVDGLRTCSAHRCDRGRLRCRRKAAAA
jgi:threonine dehydratase